MATVTKPIALDESLNTTELSSRNVADVLAQELSAVATAIGGIAVPSADHVSYDNSVSGLSATDVQNALDEIVSDIPTVNNGTLTIQQNGTSIGSFSANTASNVTANIKTPTADKKTATSEFSTADGGLLSKCLIDLVPVQSGSGDPYPAGGGKNKFGGFVYSVTQDGITASFDGNGKVTLQGTASASTYIPDRTAALNNGYVFILTAGTYTISTTNIPSQARIEVVKTDGTVIKIGDGSFTLTETTINIVRLFITSGAVISNLITVDIQLEVGSTATSWTPYSNVRPISGHTEVDLLNVGEENLCTIESGAISTITGEDTPDSNVKRTQGMISVVPNGNYVISGFTSGSATIRIFKYDLYGSFISSYTISAVDYIITLTIPNDAYNIRFQGASSIFTNDVQMRISHLYQVQIGSTVYGGYVDLVSGVMIVDRAIVDLGSMNWQYNAQGFMYSTSIMSNTKAPATPQEKANIISSGFKIETTNHIYNGYDGIGVHTDGVIYAKYSGMSTTPATFKTDVSGITLCYELATPQTIQLTPQQIEALVGQNNLSTPLSGQSIETNGVEYKELFTFADVKEYVDNKIPDAPTTDGTYTLQAVVSGGVPTYSWV